MKRSQVVRRLHLIATLALAVALFCLLVAGSAVAMTGGTSCTAAGCHLGVRTSAPITHGPILCDTSGCHNGEFGYETLPYDNSDHIGEACANCHSTSFPAVPQHSTSPAHPTDTSPFTECASCHNPDLVNEHDTHQPFTCATCHSPSASALTQVAIAARRLRLQRVPPGLSGRARFPR